MSQRAIFITGAASGIGRATALLFASKGWYVGLFDVQEAQLSVLAAEIGETNSCYQVMDVTSPASVSDAVAFFGRRTDQRMDVLFNCAGILSMGPHHRTAIETQRKIVAVNLTGILDCIHACFDLLRGNGQAHIINMSSGSAVYGTPELAVYSATKFAVRGLTEALNIEFEQFGITVCDVMANYVRTPMILDAKTHASSVDRLGVHIEPEDVARGVWRSAHGKKVHRRVGLMTHLSSLFAWAFPFAAKRVTQLLGFSPEHTGTAK